MSMAKIDLEQIKADRDAGTRGPWRIVRYDAGDDRVPCNTPMIDGPEEYDAAVVHWDGFKQSYWSSAHGDERAIDANANRIARVPELEDALIEAVKLLEGLEFADNTRNPAISIFLERFE